jgi:hypothetical protein
MKHRVELRPGSEPDLGGRSPILPLMFRQPASLPSVAAHNRNHPLARLNSTPRKVLSYQTPLEVFTAHIMKSVRIEPEFRRWFVSKTDVFDTIYRPRELSARGDPLEKLATVDLA